MSDRSITNLIIIISAFSFISCGGFVLDDVNYAQQIESVLSPDQAGIVNDQRHGLSFNVLPFQQEETGDISSVKIEQIRLIRNSDGFYFVTAEGFKNVYIMEPDKGSMKLRKKVLVSEEGIASPAFNFRGTYIELIDLESDQIYSLTSAGMKKIKSTEEAS